MAGVDAEPTVTVLQSFPAPGPATNPYIAQLRDALAAEPGVRLHTFSWRVAVLGRYDVFHAHWPETLVMPRRPVTTLVRRVLAVALLGRLRLARTPVIRTVHNLELPSGIGGFQRWFLRQLEALTTVRIRLNRRTPVPDEAAAVTILHGHYRDRLSQYERRPRIPGRLGYFGLIRRYKGVETLVEAFEQLDGEVSLSVGGQPSAEELAASLRDLAARDPRITLTLRFLDEAELVALATAAHLVVLPYRHMHNSGSALAALSLARPVLVPDNAVNRDLAEEVGETWVQTYRGELAAEDLSRALDATAGLGETDAPDLSGRDWADAGARHLDAYRLALGLRYSR